MRGQIRQIGHLVLANGPCSIVLLQLIVIELDASELKHEIIQFSEQIL